MRVLVVTSEAVPFAKSGGLGDVCGALPRALARRGHDVRVVMPRYRRVDRSSLDPLPGPLGVPTGAGERWCLVLEGRLRGSEVPVYFLEHDALFDREELYGPPGEAYADNCLRFTLLARGALQLCHKLGFHPEVFHCHDWQTALLPLLLRSFEAGSPLGRAATVLTVHNLAYQGRFAAHELAITGLGPEWLTPEELEFYGGVDFLKGGILHADLVTTVSPTYAEEICTPAFGEGLDGVLRRRGSAVRGILNGIDDILWDPSTDPLLPDRYDAEDLAGKATCKEALRGRFGLPAGDGAVAGFVGRLVEQKGVDLLLDAAAGLGKLGVRVVALGAGAARYEERLRGLASAEGGLLRAVIGFDEALAHLVYAGSDLLLMPSRYEPCGLNQLYAMRYGTLPIVMDVGGLSDSVVDPFEGRGPATGFKLEAPTAEALVDAVRWAEATRRHAPASFREMVRAGMGRRSGWDEAASLYETIFEEAAGVATRRHPG